jgi:hydroxymethylpyrimidine/phosphomethylpyrimidine kinase
VRNYRRALTIAGSDSGGGAGIQADLKTFSALGCYGLSVITALTAQNTREVRGIHGVPPAFVAQQIDAVLDDVGADAVKIGMLASAEIITAVSERLRAYGAGPIVLDPVMVAKSGDRLLAEDAIERLRRELVPLADVLTPNAPEAEVLSGRTIETAEGALAASVELLELGPRVVLLKGGHMGGDKSSDLLASRGGRVWLEAPRVDTPNTHGTGCTLSSAIAAHLARGRAPDEAIRAAKTYLAEAIRRGAGYRLGEGHGPVHHFHAFWG